MFDSGLALQRYLRALWGIGPALHFDAAAPCIEGGALHLPSGSTALQRAAAVHAAAHLVFSPPVFEGAAPGPIVRALVGVLEDARVEALAGRALPGLRRLWARLHVATPADGEGVEALLRRLARALADADYADPHPWVRKGRAMFYLDDVGTVLALPRAEQVRLAASLLGNDLGQMRLQFNARLYVPAPAYRDDHRWMWAQPQSPAAIEVPAMPVAAPDAPEPGVPAGPVRRYPEWDRRIARLRRDWCSVQVVDGVTGEAPDATPATRIGAATVQAIARARARPRRLAVDGEVLDVDAAVEARIAGRLGRPVDERLWRETTRSRRRRAATLLIDQSASTAAPWGRSGVTLLSAASSLAARLAAGLEGAGVATAIGSFSSNGRHAVRLQRIKTGAERFDAAVRSRLAALRAGGSTRLGTVLRDAVARRDAATRFVLVISDGEPHDVDVHDPGYLVADARHAVRWATRQGLALACLVLDPAGAGTAARVFGPRRVGVLQAFGQLPRALRRIVLR
jgi:nitric oxide reductase NorD protein